MNSVIIFDYVQGRVSVVGNNPQQEPALSKVLDTQKIAVPAAAGAPPSEKPQG